MTNLFSFLIPKLLVKILSLRKMTTLNVQLIVKEQPLYVYVVKVIFFLSVPIVKDTRHRRNAKHLLGDGQRDRILIHFSDESIMELVYNNPSSKDTSNRRHQTVIKSAVLDIALSVCHPADQKLNNEVQIPHY